MKPAPATLTAGHGNNLHPKCSPREPQIPSSPTRAFEPFPKAAADSLSSPGTGPSPVLYATQPRACSCFCSSLNNPPGGVGSCLCLLSSSVGSRHPPTRDRLPQCVVWLKIKRTALLAEAPGHPFTPTALDVQSSDRAQEAALSEAPQPQGTSSLTCRETHSEELLHGGFLGLQKLWDNAVILRQDLCMW